MSHNIVRLSGTLPGGEVWATGIAMAPGGAGSVVTDFTELQEWADGIRDNLQAPTGNITPLLELLSLQGRITAVRVEHRDLGLLQAAGETQIIPSVVGTGIPDKPHSCAVVLSLRTGRPGRSYRGRSYWPCLAATLATATLRLSDPTTTEVANAAAALLLELSGAAPSPQNAGVYSTLLDVVTPVTAVWVGDVIDTQRRRRDDLEEIYAIVDTPLAP